MKQINSLIVFALWHITSLSAQPFEIRTFSDGSNNISIQLRSTSNTPPTTANRVTDLVFGVKWPKTCGANLDLATIVNSGFNLGTSGIRSENGLNYFRAFGAEPIGYALSSSWTREQWVTVMSLTTNQLGNNGCTFEICARGFDLSTDPNFAIDFTDYQPIINGSSNLVLPLDLLEFTAQSDKQTAFLNWKTADERNVSHFDIEKSTNAKTWTTIGQQKAQNTEGYAFTDEHAFEASNSVFYRLKMVDTDGTFRYSPVRQLVSTKTVDLKVYPNPAKNSVSVVGTDAEGNWQIVDVVGKVIGQYKGNRTIDLTAYTEGVYFAKTERGSVLRFVVIQ